MTPTVRSRLWTFVWLNVLAIGAALALFAFVLHAEFLSAPARAAWRWLARHEVVTALAASTPLFAALLVGRASANARRRQSQSPSGPNSPQISRT